MNRLTFYEKDGSFGVVGMNADNESQKLYICVCKLLDLENLMEEYNIKDIDELEKILKKMKI